MQQIKIFHLNEFYNHQSLEGAVNKWRSEIENDKTIRITQEETLIGGKNANISFVFHYEKDDKYDLSVKDFIEKSIISELGNLLFHLAKYTETGKIVWTKTVKKKYDTIVKPDGDARAEVVTLTTEENRATVTLIFTVPEIAGEADIKNWHHNGMIILIKRGNESVQKEILGSEQHYAIRGIISLLFDNIKKQLEKDKQE